METTLGQQRLGGLSPSSIYPEAALCAKSNLKREEMGSLCQGLSTQALSRFRWTAEQWQLVIKAEQSGYGIRVRVNASSFCGGTGIG
jgi:hypothetical protein